MLKSLCVFLLWVLECTVFSLFHSIPCHLPKVTPIILSSYVSLFSYLLFHWSVVSDCLWPHGLQHTRLLCPSSPRACSNSCPLSRWCHPSISSSVIPFSSFPQSFPASGYFLMSWLFTSGSQSIGVSVSASVLPMNIQDWFPLRLTGLISLQSRELSRVFSNTTVQKHQFLGLSLLYGQTLTSIHDYWENHSFDYMNLCWQSNIYVIHMLALQL